MEDKEYTLILNSKDGHSFEFKTNTVSEDEATKKGFQKLEDLGYNNYSYELKEIKSPITQK